MKKYKFTVKKILENTIELKAKNQKEAIADIADIIILSEDEVFKNLNSNDIEYTIDLEQIKDLETGETKKISKRIKTFVEKDKEDDEKEYLDNDEIFEKNDDDFEENEDDYEETEEDFLDGTLKIICNKCGNNIHFNNNLED